MDGITTGAQHRPAHLKKKHIYFVLTCLIIVAGVGGYFAWRVYTKPAIQVGTTKVSKKRYNLLNNESKTSVLANKGAQQQAGKRSIAEVISEAEKYKLVAKQLNIDVTDESIASNASVLYDLQGKAPNEWQKEASYKAAFDGAMLVSQTATAKVGIYHFGFGRYIDSNELKPSDPNFGNPTAIASDRAYALSKANEYRNNLAQKKISPDDAIKSILSDSRLVFGTFGNRSRRVAISDTGYVVGVGGGLSGETLFTREMDVIKKLKVGEISEINVTNVALNRKPGEKALKYADMGLYFIQLESKNTSRSELYKQVDLELSKIKVIKNV